MAPPKVIAIAANNKIDRIAKTESGIFLKRDIVRSLGYMDNIAYPIKHKNKTPNNQYGVPSIGNILYFITMGRQKENSRIADIP